MYPFQRIRDLRKAHGYTQLKVALYLHCTQSAYSKYESSPVPPVNILIQLSKLYRVSVDYLLNLTDKPRSDEKTG